MEVVDRIRVGVKVDFNDGSRASWARGGTLRFSQAFGVADSVDDDWFDTFLPEDTKLYVDPFLIWDDPDPLWSGAHDHLIDFFEMAIELVRESNGDPKHNSWKQAEQLLLFPEPAEFVLGVTEGSPLGTGSGPRRKREMLESIRTAIDVGMSRIVHLETLSLFQGGMGPDRMSDMVCNILKSYFVKYTQSVASRHDVRLQSIQLKNSGWSSEYCRWFTRKCDLPVNPYYDMPVLLVPERFLRAMPVASGPGFVSWALSHGGGSLRTDLNFDVTQRLAKRDKPWRARFAQQNPEAVALYLEHLENEPKEPYPVVEDPNDRVRFNDREKSVASVSPLNFVARRPEEFERFVREIVEAFRHGVQEEGNWTMLWHRGEPLAEKAAQDLFRNTAVHYCRANDVDLTREASAGRGPVDFKFSQGWNAKALVEIKLVRNSRFWDGILSQQPTYQLAENVRCGVFVAIAYTDEECSPEVGSKLAKAAQIVKESSGISIVPVLVDARPRVSGSKVRDAELLRRLRTES